MITDIFSLVETEHYESLAMATSFFQSRPRVKKSSNGSTPPAPETWVTRVTPCSHCCILPWKIILFIDDTPS